MARSGPCFYIAIQSILGSLKFAPLQPGFASGFTSDLLQGI